MKRLAGVALTLPVTAVMAITVPARPDAGLPARTVPDPDDLFYRTATALLRQALVRRVGPADSYEIRFDRENSTPREGRIGGVDITAVNVQLGEGLVLSRVELRAREIEMEPGLRRVRRFGSAVFSASLTREALLRYVQERASPRLKEVRIAFNRGRIIVRARPEVAGVKLPSELAGRLVPSGPDAIHFRASRVALLGVRITDLAARVVEKQVNPLVDFAALKLPVRIQRVRVFDEAVVLEGEGDLSRLNPPASAPPSPPPAPLPGGTPPASSRL